MPQQSSVGVAIIGGSGYGAGELLRLLATHPAVKICSVVSSTSAGQKIEMFHPHLAGFIGGEFVSEIDFAALLKFPKRFIFLSLPHGTSAAAAEKLMPEIEKTEAHLIDLSGDFRLSDPRLRKKFYPEADTAQELQQRFAYGLTETNRQAVLNSRFSATPGCLAAVCILAAAPLVADGFQGTLVFDAKTGSSGGGKTPKDIFHHPSRHANVTPYKILDHRHEPEIAQGLGDPEGKNLTIFFVPHLVPASRGIFVTLYAELRKETTVAALTEQYRKHYADSPFVRVRDDVPSLHAVVGTNFCDIGLAARGRQVVVMAALDNLVKGTAGQAIQNMNLLCGLPETTGLWFPGLGPC